MPGPAIRPGPQALAFYGAERFLHDSECYFELASIQSAVTEVVRDGDVRARAPWLPEAVQVRSSTRMAYDGRADRRAGSITLNGRIPVVGQTLVLHELAHLVAPCSGHGPRFAATFDMLLGRFASWYQRPDVGWHATHPYGPEQQVRLRVGMRRGGLRFPSGPPMLPAQFEAMLDPALDDRAVEESLSSLLFDWEPRRCLPER